MSVPILSADERLSLNVGGVRFQTLRSTLAREPHTTLGELARNTPVFADDHQKQDYYFDRSSTMFDYVLNYYRTGELHFPHNFCPSVVKQELEFWNIDGKEMQDCCWKRYLKVCAKFVFCCGNICFYDVNLLSDSNILQLMQIMLVNFSGVVTEKLM